MGHGASLIIHHAPGIGTEPLAAWLSCRPGSSSVAALGEAQAFQVLCGGTSLHSAVGDRARFILRRKGAVSAFNSLLIATSGAAGMAVRQPDAYHLMPTVFVLLTLMCRPWRLKAKPPSSTSQQQASRPNGSERERSW